MRISAIIAVLWPSAAMAAPYAEALAVLLGR